MNPDAARRILVTQHEELRTRMRVCSVLAQQLLRGEAVRRELDLELSRLRSSFAVHNSTETELVRPLLHGSPDWGVVLIDRMLEEHVAEHAAFWEQLDGTTDELAARMDDLVDELDAHMAAEERTFLSPGVLDANVIARHQRP
jgi:iron-sulfur cluster repair protein YtfE (RIC family)